MTNKYRPRIVGRFRVCKRQHKDYVKECPDCNVPVLGEEHQDKARNLLVTVPRYRKQIVYKGKDYKRPNTTTEEAV